MSGETTIRRLFNKKLETKASGIPATIGNLDGVVSVPGMSNTCYCTMENGTVLQVYNVKTPYMYGLPVYIGRDPLEPRKWQVVSVRSTIQIIDDSGTGTGSGNVPHHHQTHEWTGNGSNDDLVRVDIRQIRNLMVQPAGGLSVYVNQGIVYAGSAWSVLPGTTVDLSLSVPVTAGQALYVLLSAAGGVVTVTVGSEVNFTALALSDIPDIPAGNFALAAVRVYYGQSVISETVANTDIVDLRWQTRDSGTAPIAHAASHTGRGSDPLTTRWEPVTYNDEILTYNHDVLMLEV